MNRRQSVRDATIGHWIGVDSRQVGALSDVHVLAWIIGPFTTPNTDNLPLTWEQSCIKIISKFHESPEDQDDCMKGQTNHTASGRMESGDSTKTKSYRPTEQSFFFINC